MLAPAAGLYGNIGIKVLYANVLEELFGFPAMVSRKGRYVWTVIVVIYWSIAFVVSVLIEMEFGRNKHTDM